jgi:hypothetical protein
MVNRTSVIITTVALVVTLVSCTPGTPEPMPTVLPPTIEPGDAIPPPKQEVILTISGDIGTTNVGDTLQFDMPTLESLGLVKYSVPDPYRLEDVTYTGVLMSSLKEYLQASGSAQNFHIIALDDYQVDLSFNEIEKWPILLATRSNGEHMTVENSGPTRIIFPYGLYDLDPVRYNDLWIWNIESMQVN